MNKLSERIKLGLLEGIEYAKGTTPLVSHAVKIPVGKEYSGEEVRALRQRYGMSQASFARYLMVSVKTLQSWEQGSRKPSKPTMRLLQIFDSPSEFAEILREAPRNYDS